MTTNHWLAAMPSVAKQATAMSSIGAHPRVTAIILNYRNYADTIHCVRVLLEQHYPALNCLVVDNASPNESADRLVAALGSEKSVSIVISPRNGGYAAGNNYGACWAVENLSPDYLLIVNPDVIMRDPETLSCLVDFAEGQHDAAVVSPRVILPGGFHQGPYERPNLLKICIHYVFPFVWYFARKRHQLWARNATYPTKCFRTIGACMLLRANDFVSIGMFDEATFLEGEELILAERLLVEGKHFYHFPKVTVVHNHTRLGKNQDVIKGLVYYFRKYRRAWPSSVLVLQICAKVYDFVYSPFARHFR